MQRVLPVAFVVWIFSLINLFLYNIFRAKEEVASVTFNTFIGTILFTFIIVPLLFIVSQLQKKKKWVINICLLVFVTLVVIGGLGYLSFEDSNLDVEKPLLIPMLIYFVGLGWFISAIAILLIQPKTQYNSSR